MTASSLGFGRPADLRSLAEQVRSGQSLQPEALVLHLRAAAERIERHDTTRRSEADREERRAQAVTRALGSVTSACLVDAFDPTGFFVYCLWGKDRTRPLYVGQSGNILRRLGDHLGDPFKRRAIKSVTLSRCPTYVRMRALETAMIREYQPPWNSVGIVATA